MCTRRGAAPWAVGDECRPLVLDGERDSIKFCEFVSLLARGGRTEPHVAFRVAFVWPNPKLNPTTPD